jgi:hypothetical protein
MATAQIAAAIRAVHRHAAAVSIVSSARLRNALTTSHVAK